ncbi:MAG TPA: FAD-dependent monooxygenase [Candidatus Polarisedimenticolaceae bacterium]|nr:FAD-dependent monooxygenase [Candidatus Polarisedimenticolaceae bacterium]
MKGETQTVVIGAGPVGKFAALSLARLGVEVEILDEGSRGAVHSYALALHPESLRLLDELGVADELVASGQRIERMGFHRRDERLGQLDFSELGGPFPFVLVAPQSALEQALEQRLNREKVRVWWKHQALAVSQDAARVALRVGRREKYSMGYPVAGTEWMITRESDVHSRFLIGADGYHSFVRRSHDDAFESGGPAQVFSVYEFPLTVDAPQEARVFFHDGTTNVFWPLHDRRGRLSFQVEPGSPPSPSVEGLNDLIRERVSWLPAEIEQVYWTSTAMFERRLAKSLGSNRIWLAGDAAHLTGPVGAQSMNVGLREAHDLARRIADGIARGASADAIGSYDADWRAEWRALLNLDGRLEATPALAKALGAQLAELPACVPASGADLDALLSQIGVRLR